MNKEEMKKALEELQKQVDELKAELEKKEEQDKIWQPKKDEKFFYVDAKGIVGCSYRNCMDHTTKINFGNYYKTEEEAEFAANRQKYTNLYRKYVEEHSEPIDFNSGHQHHWYAFYDWDNCEICIGTNYNQDAFQIYAHDKQIIYDAIAFIGEDNMKKYIFGVAE